MGLPDHIALDSGGFLGKVYEALLVKVFFREGHGYWSKMYAYSEHIGALHFHIVFCELDTDGKLRKLRFSNIPTGYDRFGNGYSKDIDGYGILSC